MSSSPSRQIEVLVHPNGALRIDAVGYTGNSCEEATAFLEKALGTVNERQRAPEFYRPAGSTRRAQKQQKVQS